MLYKKKTVPDVKRSSIADDMVNLGAVAAALDQRYRPRARKVLQGRNRTVYVMGTYVVKVPRNLDGIADNDWEGSVRNGAVIGEYSTIYPKHKRLAYWKSIPVVFMERVVHASSKQIVKRLGKVPPWVDQIDCGQVGFNRNGTLVAYDYGTR